MGGRSHLFSPLQYVGHQVECDGFVLDTTFLGERIQIVE